MPKGDFPEGKTPWHKTSAKTLAMLEQSGARYNWWEDYLELRAQGHGWKIAVYIAWASSPTDRQPRTQGELAERVLGVSDRTIRKWRTADPTIDETVSLLQAAPLLAHRRDVIDALVAVARDPDPKAHSDRKLFLEMTGDYKPRSTLEHDGRLNVSGFTADDLTQAEFELGEYLDEKGTGDAAPA